MTSATPLRLFALLLAAAPVTLQVGCVVDTTPRGIAGNEDPGIADEADGGEPDAEAVPADAGHQAPDRGVPDAAEAPADAEPLPPDAAPIDEPPVDPEDCAAVCAFRAQGLPGWGSCPLESFRTPGISYDCVQTCQRAQAWASPFREAAGDCATQQPLCFESLEGCAMRNSESDAQLQVWVGIGGIGDVVGRRVGLAAEGIEPAQVLSDFAGNASLEVRVPIQRASSLGMYLWVDEDGDGRCDLSRDRFGLVWLPGFEQLGGAPEDHPLATLRVEMQVSGQRDIWLEDPARRLPAACDGHPR